MPGATPIIGFGSIPGGHILVYEAGLPNGSDAGGQSRTSNSFSFTITAEDGIDDLTIGGHAFILDGVATPGSFALGPGVLRATFDAATRTVLVNYEITAPLQSAFAGPQGKYGDFLSPPVVLTDRDGDRAEARLDIQIRDDEAITPSSDSATATAGGPAATGNLITGGVPDKLTADGFGRITGIGHTSSGGSWTTDAAGDIVFQGGYGVLRIDPDTGAYSYVARADAPDGASEAVTYFLTDGDGDSTHSTFMVTVRAGDPSPGGKAIAAPGPNATLAGGAGDDTITASAGGDTITTGGGADVLVLPTPPWAPHIVKDFALGTDRLDFQGMSGFYGGSDPVGDKYIHFLDDGAGGVKVLWDRDGAATGQQWPDYILHLQGVSAQGLTWTQLSGGGGTTEPPPTSGQLLNSPGPGSTLTGGAGNDTLNASQGSDTLTGGGGNDVFAWAAEPWSPATVKDFALGADKLDLSKLFQAAGYSGSDPVADGRVVLMAQGSDTLVLFDDDGAGGDWPNYIIKLEGVANSGLTWAKLSSGGTSEPPPSTGGQTITSPGPGSTLTGGAGADTLISSRGEDLLTGAAGADHFVFPGENWAPARITDFEDGVDRIDIRGMLDAIGYTGTDPFGAGLLTLVDDGAGGTLVLFDRDAGGPNPEWPNYVFRVEHVAPSALGPSDWVFQ